MAMIVVDSREAAGVPKIIEGLEKAGIEVKIDYLEAGDYLAGDVLVERKTVMDLLGSVRSGRLWRELDKMKRAEGVRPVVAIEGSLALAEKLSKWSPTAICGVVNSIALDWGVPTVFLPSRRWMVMYLIQLAKSAELEGRRVRALRVKEKCERLSDLQRFLVEGLPGISAARAELLLKTFGSPRRVFTASKEELTSVKGIGEKLAEKIIEVLTSKYVE